MLQCFKLVGHIHTKEYEIEVQTNEEICIQEMTWWSDTVEPRISHKELESHHQQLAREGWGKNMKDFYSR